MDGLRKVPDNVPQREMMTEHRKTMTGVPDPFGTHDSFGAHNNARLREFLDRFGFDYEFKSATECYTSGQFDETLLQILERYDAITGVIKPTLGEERRATYSPFLPVCPKTGRVLLAKIVETKTDAGTVVYEDEDGSLSKRRLPAGTANSSGRPIGPCVGPLCRSITRCPAKI